MTIKDKKRTKITTTAIPMTAPTKTTTLLELLGDVSTVLLGVGETVELMRIDDCGGKSVCGISIVVSEEVSVIDGGIFSVVGESD